MKIYFVLLITFILAFCKHKDHSADEQGVKAVIDSFYYAFINDDFKNMSGYTTDDISFISPTGLWFTGRKELEDTIQKIPNNLPGEKTVSIDTMSIKFVAPDIAIVNLVDKMGIFFSPDGVRGKENAIRTFRTFVIVKKEDKWKLMQNQNTIIN